MKELLSDFFWEQIEAILALAPLAITIIEMPSQKYILANANYCRALRTPMEPKDLVGKTVSEVLKSPNPEALNSMLRAHLQGEATKFDTIVSHSVGAAVTYWTGAAVPVFRDESRTLVLGLLAEVTQRVLAQEEAERRQRELEAEKERTVEFMAMAVHELRTPLTSLKMLTQLLLAQQEKGERSDILRTIDRQSARLVRLINDLLSSVKSSTGQLELHLEEVAVVDFLEELVRESPTFSSEGKVEFRSASGKEPVFAKADRDRLRQVMLNLIHNAFMHSESSEPVQLSFALAPSSVRLEVRDEGKGIAAEDLERIFDRFYRRQSEKRVSGLGLGLYLSRRLIEGMGGAVWAESEGLNRGCRFIVELPRTVG